VAVIEWVVSMCLLVVSGVLPGFGRLGDLRSHRGVYLAGFAGSVATSAPRGLAPSAFRGGVSRPAISTPARCARARA
jgi:MFS family permease